MIWTIEALMGRIKLLAKEMDSLRRRDWDRAKTFSGLAYAQERVFDVMMHLLIVPKALYEIKEKAVVFPPNFEYWNRLAELTVAYEALVKHSSLNEFWDYQQNFNRRFRELLDERGLWDGPVSDGDEEGER
jgi:squalene cyclase